MLNAFVDGSGPGHNNGRYVMAGYVAFCPIWSDIAERWEQTLAETPSIPKFKLTLSRNKEWRDQVGITEDQMERKIALLSELVTPPKTLFSVICSISEPDFKRVVEETNIKSNKHVRKVLGKYVFKTPYATLFHNVVARTLNKVRDLGIVGDQVDFVFDRENELFDNANDLLRRTRRFFDPALFHMCGDAIQRDEDRVLPLQAADLIAGVAKDHCNDPQNMEIRNQLLSLSGKGEHNATLHLTEQHIRNAITAITRPMPEGWKPPYDWGVAL
jgi:hypothetical protein